MAQQEMPKLIKLYIRSCALGFAAAAAFVGGLLWFDLAGLWGLVARTDGGALAVVILWVLHGIVFAGLQFGFAIMSMAGTRPDDDDQGKRDPIWTPDAVPVESGERSERHRSR